MKRKSKLRDVTFASGAKGTLTEYSCDNCRCYGPVLEMDNSYQEYTPNYLCKKCIDALFNAAEFFRGSDETLPISTKI